MAALKYPEKMLFLTTLDNPFNPATEPEFWAQYDRDHGYYSYNLLARSLWTSDQLSESEQVEANNNAVLDVVDNDLTGKFIAVYETTRIKPIKIEELEKEAIS